MSTLFNNDRVSDLKEEAESQYSLEDMIVVQSSIEKIRNGTLSPVDDQLFGLALLNLNLTRDDDYHSFMSQQNIQDRINPEVNTRGSLRSMETLADFLQTMDTYTLPTEWHSAFEALSMEVGDELNYPMQCIRIDPDLDLKTNKLRLETWSTQVWGSMQNWWSDNNIDPRETMADDQGVYQDDKNLKQLLNRLRMKAARADRGGRLTVTAKDPKRYAERLEEIGVFIEVRDNKTLLDGLFKLLLDNDHQTNLSKLSKLEHKTTLPLDFQLGALELQKEFWNMNTDKFFDEFDNYTHGASNRNLFNTILGQVLNNEKYFLIVRDTDKNYADNVVFNDVAEFAVETAANYAEKIDMVSVFLNNIFKRIRAIVMKQGVGEATNEIVTLIQYFDIYKGILSNIYTYMVSIEKALDLITDEGKRASLSTEDYSVYLTEKDASTLAREVTDYSSFVTYQVTQQKHEIRTVTDLKLVTENYNIAISGCKELTATEVLELEYHYAGESLASSVKTLFKRVGRALRNMITWIMEKIGMDVSHRKEITKNPFPNGAPKRSQMTGPEDLTSSRNKPKMSRFEAIRVKQKKRKEERRLAKKEAERARGAKQAMKKEEKAKFASNKKKEGKVEEEGKVLLPVASKINVRYLALNATSDLITKIKTSEIFDINHYLINFYSNVVMKKAVIISKEILTFFAWITARAEDVRRVLEFDGDELPFVDSPELHPMIELVGKHRNAVNMCLRAGTLVMQVVHWDITAPTQMLVKTILQSGLEGKNEEFDGLIAGKDTQKVLEKAKEELDFIGSHAQYGRDMIAQIQGVMTHVAGLLKAWYSCRHQHGQAVDVVRKNILSCEVKLKSMGVAV